MMCENHGVDTFLLYLSNIYLMHKENQLLLSHKLENMKLTCKKIQNRF